MYRVAEKKNEKDIIILYSSILKSDNQNGSMYKHLKITASISYLHPVNNTYKNILLLLPATIPYSYRLYIYIHTYRYIHVGIRIKVFNLSPVLH